MSQIAINIIAIDPDGDSIVAMEGRYRLVGASAWSTSFTINPNDQKVKDGLSAGNYELQARVRDDRGAWSQWGPEVPKNFTIVPSNTFQQLSIYQVYDCSQEDGEFTIVYSNPGDTIPEEGKIIYTDAALSQRFNGSNNSYKAVYQTEHGNLTLFKIFDIGTDGVINYVEDCLQGETYYTILSEVSEQCESRMEVEVYASNSEPRKVSIDGGAAQSIIQNAIITLKISGEYTGGNQYNIATKKLTIRNNSNEVLAEVILERQVSTATGINFQHSVCLDESPLPSENL